MRLWLLTSEFPPDYAGGGISAYCTEFAGALTRAGSSVTVFTCAGPGKLDLSQDSHDGYHVVRVPPWPGRGLEASLGHWARLSYCIAEAVIARLESGDERPDLIEVQDYGALGYFLLKHKLLGRPLLADIPIVVMCHTPTFEIVELNEEPEYKFPVYWVCRAERFCLLAADALISPSRFLADRLSAQIDRPITTLPLPMRIGTAPQRSEDSYTTDLLYVGRYELRKGVLQLVDAMAQLWDSGSRQRLRLVGGDTHWQAKGINVRDHLARKYARYVDRGLLVMSDRVGRRELARIMGSAKVLVVPSLYENFPYVCTEGMSNALPVIASASGGQAEMVGCDGKRGIVFDWDKEGDFARAVTSMLELSESERLAMGRAAHAHIITLTNPETYVAKRHELLNELLATLQPASRYPFLNQAIDRKNPRPYALAPTASEKPGLLSVVIPHYNLGPYVTEAVSSVMKSGYRDIEVVLVDDGSTDAASLETVREIGKTTWRYPLRIVSIENGGLANARNVGVEAALGEYVAFLDADDRVSESYYAKCMQILSRYDNVSFVYSWVRYFGKNEAIWANFDTELPFMFGGNMLAAFQVVRRQDYLRYGRNNPKMRYGLEDYEAWLRMVGQGCLGVSIPEPLVDYRVREDSMSRAWTPNTTIYLRERVATLNEELFEGWGADVLKLMSANGPGWLWNTAAVEYAPIGYLNSPAQQSRFASLRFKFDPQEADTIAKVLDDPAALWLVRAVMRWRLHGFAVGVARFLLKVRLLFPRRGR